MDFELSSNVCGRLHVQYTMIVLEQTTLSEPHVSVGKTLLSYMDSTYNLCLERFWCVVNYYLFHYLLLLLCYLILLLLYLFFFFILPIVYVGSNSQWSSPQQTHSQSVYDNYRKKERKTNQKTLKIRHEQTTYCNCGCACHCVLH